VCIKRILKPGCPKIGGGCKGLHPRSIEGASALPDTVPRVDTGNGEKIRKWKSERHRNLRGREMGNVLLWLKDG